MIGRHYEPLKEINSNKDVKLNESNENRSFLGKK